VTEGAFQTGKPTLLALVAERRTFGKFVDPRVVVSLIDPAGDKDLAERQVATVFFSDIKGFSGLGELLIATALVKLLNMNDLRAAS